VSADRDTGYPIRARDITKAVRLSRRHHLQILRGLSFDIEWSSMTAIVGRSGSGKSTLLHCLAGLEPVSGGSVELDGVDIGGCSRSQAAKLRRSSVGFVFQAYNLVPTMTVYQNVAMPFHLRGERPPRRRIRQVLDQLGLEARVRARPATLSGGEQQRVALARVLVTEPRIVFADEPTGALDSASAEVVLRSLRDIADMPGRSVVLVTHDHDVAARCDRVLALDAGVLVLDEVNPLRADA
jgi:putative ABC transport system ATP-binding protein